MTKGLGPLSALKGQQDVPHHSCHHLGDENQGSGRGKVMEGQGITGWTGVRMNLFTVGTLQADGKKASETVSSIPANQLVGK